MEIRNLKTFLHAAALQNITKASVELGYSQSAVSVQIRQLEQEIGLPLFDRIGKNVFLTSYGRALLPYARKAVTAAMDIENFSKSPETLTGSVRIGITDSLFELLMKSILLKYHDRFPRVSLELLVDTTVNLTQQLEQSSIDAACIIDDQVSPADWHIWYAMDIPIVLAANPKHPLSEQADVTLQDLSGSELIMMERDAPYSKRFESILTKHNVEYRPFLRIPSANTARELILEENFISLLPLYTVQSYVNEGKLCIINVPEWSLSQSVQMILHRSKVITPQIEGFLSELRTALESILISN